MCSYVLAFATLVSVMAGYRAQLTGMFGYREGNASQVMPLHETYQAQVVVYDGQRIGLLYGHNETAGPRPRFDKILDHDVWHSISQLLNAQYGIIKGFGLSDSVPPARSGLRVYAKGQHGAIAKNYELVS